MKEKESSGRNTLGDEEEGERQNSRHDETGMQRDGRKTRNKGGETGKKANQHARVSFGIPSPLPGSISVTSQPDCLAQAVTQTPPEPSINTVKKSVEETKQEEEQDPQTG